MKGQAFEREICKKLSVWLSRNADPFCLWRTHGSGGRATQLRKTRKATLSDQLGDIAGQTELGKDFCARWVFSLKTGYCSHGMYDLLELLDKPNKHSLLVRWWAEVAELAEDNDRSPILIVRRFRREPIVLLPAAFLQHLCLLGVAPSTWIELHHELDSVGVISLKDFCKIPPEVFLNVGAGNV